MVGNAEINVKARHEDCEHSWKLESIRITFAKFQDVGFGWDVELSSIYLILKGGVTKTSNLL